MLEMDHQQKLRGLNKQFAQVLVNLYFLQGISRKPERGIKTPKGIKLNCDENYSKRLQRTRGGNPPRQNSRGRQVRLAGPTLVPPGPLQWLPPINF
jgi:hypothetical protein